MWSRAGTIVAGFSIFGEVALRAGLYQFRSYALCLEVSRLDISQKGRV